MAPYRSILSLGSFTLTAPALTLPCRKPRESNIFNVVVTDDGLPIAPFFRSGVTVIVDCIALYD